MELACSSFSGSALLPGSAAPAAQATAEKSFAAQQPNIPSKELSISATDFSISATDLGISAKEPGISAKEPGISAKELDISAGTLEPPPEGVVDMIIRPTNVLDPEIDIYPREGQLEQLLLSSAAAIALGDRVLVMALTKRDAEDVAGWMCDKGIVALCVCVCVCVCACDDTQRQGCCWLDV